MSKIIGVTVGTPMSVSTIKEKLKPVTSVNGVAADEHGNVEVQVSTGLPEVTAADNGKVLTVGENGLPMWAEASGGVNVTTCTLPRGRMKGDVDGDGQISVADSDLLQAYISRLVTLDEVQLWCGDTTNDGKYRTGDCTQIKRLCGGLSNNLTGDPTFADYYGTWTYVKVDDLNGYFYTDIAVESITAQTDVMAVVRGEFTDGNYTEIIPQDGGLRVCAKRIPIAEVSMIVNYWEGNGTGVILQERSVPSSLAQPSVSLLSSSVSGTVFDITVDDTGVPATTNVKDGSVVNLQKAVTGTAGQFVVIGAGGVAEAATPAAVQVRSSTDGSAKVFNITVDDSGTITATEVTA